LGNDRCTVKHGGTSAAAPIAAGVIALALQIRPDLSWRDIQHILVATAVPVAPKHDSWISRTKRKSYSPFYGFGKIDAAAVVDRAKKWRLVRPPIVRSLPTRELNGVLAWPHFTVKDTIVVPLMPEIAYLEHVTVRLTLEHTRRGDAQYWLKSPAGTLVPLASSRPNDDSRSGLKRWTFMTVAFWSEPVAGPWTLIAANVPNSRSHGRILEWTLSLWGEQSSMVQESESDYVKNFMEAHYPKRHRSRLYPREIPEEKPSWTKYFILLFGGVIFLALRRFKRAFPRTL